MKRLAITAFALVALAMGPAEAQAQRFRESLPEHLLADLPTSARVKYDEAIRFMDRTQHEQAMEALLIAADRAPKHVELNLQAAEVAGRMGMMSFGETSREFYNTGIRILERIEGEEMGGTNRERLQALLVSQRENVEAVTTRDDERMATGFRLMMTIRRERLQRAVRDSDEGARVLLGREDRAQQRDEDFFEKRAGEIWPQLGAPDRYIPPRFNPQQLGGGFGSPFAGAGGFDPAMFGDPALMGGGAFGPGGVEGGGFGPADPFAAGGDPFGSGGFGGDPFGGGAQPGGFGADPFAGGAQPGGFGGDPFGGAGGANPFVDPAAGSRK
jgi:hypothetical protein